MSRFGRRAPFRRRGRPYRRDVALITERMAAIARIPTSSSSPQRPQPKPRRLLPTGVERVQIAAAENPTTMESEEPTLWSRITLTHPIWYLQHLSRQNAAQLLSAAKEGNFIIRSSRHRDSMALSVRMPKEWPVDVEHFLIERKSNGWSLEASSLVFASLPLLVLHYSHSVDEGEELAIGLRLADGVNECATETELQKIALMGEEFWEMSRSRPPSAFFADSPESSSAMSRSVCGSLNGLGTGDDGVSPPPPRRRSTLRLGTATVSDSGDIVAATSRPKPQMGIGSGVLLRKSHSAYGGIDRNSKTPQRWHFLRSLFGQTGGPRVENEYFLPNAAAEPSARDDPPSHYNGDAAALSVVAFPSTSSLSSSVGSIGRRIARRAKDDSFNANFSDRQQMALQRGHTDLSARRLADYAPSRSSSQRQVVERQPNGRSRRFQTIAVESIPPPPMVPPHGRMNEIAMAKCIEELKRRRDVPTEREPVDRRSAVRLSVPNLSEQTEMKMEKSQTSDLSQMPEGLATPIRRRPNGRQFVRIPPNGDIPNAEMSTNSAAEAAPLFVHKIQPNWAEISRELKDRQRLVAKVKPQSMLSDSPPNEEEDDVSVAGTVFNEPWDSNALENLRDIAKFCDQKPSKSSAKAAYIECCTHEPIVEAEEDSSSSTFSNPTTNSDDVEVREVPLEEEDEIPTTSNDGIPLLGEHRLWSEVSRHIPSESGTLDSRRAASLANIPQSAMSPLFERNRRRAQTPGVLRSGLDSFPPIPSILPAISPARLRAADDPSQRIQRCIEQLAVDPDNTFGRSLQTFIECTIDAGESDARIVIRNVRQFITGMKNYLVKNGESELLELIEEESSKLRSNEFLNIDAIMEAVLHKIVLVPIKPHLYHLMCRENIRNGTFETLTANLSKIRSMSPSQLGFAGDVRLPDQRQMETIRNSIRRMQNHYSPLKKLESLLRALSVVAERTPRADELIRWLVFLLAKTSCVTCEVEAWYIWELLPPQLLTTGDAAYYLCTLFSAVHVLRNVDSINRLRFMSNEPDFSTSRTSLRCCLDEAADAYIRVAIPDEQRGAIEYHTFPAVPQMNVQRLCRIIAHQLAITNPEDFGLCILYDGFETALQRHESPSTLREQLNRTGKPHLFAFKRHDAKIAWPASAVQLSSATQPLNATLGSTQSRFL